MYAISKYPEKEAEPARGPLRKPALPLAPGKGRAICTWALRLALLLESFQLLPSRKPGLGFCPRSGAINTTPYVHLFPLPPPPPPTWPRPGLSISASCLCPSSKHPSSRRRGPLASRGQTPFPPPLLAQKGVLSHVWGCKWEGGTQRKSGCGTK